MKNRVLVLDHERQPLMPCQPARARMLLKQGKAAVFRTRPFTLILKERVGGDKQPIEAKLDPGAGTSGLALVALFKRGRTVIWSANLQHRGEGVKHNLDQRKGHRKHRPSRLGYRPRRFNNRARPKGWLAPSLQSRVDNLTHWAQRLMRWCPVMEVAVETAKFDTQLLVHPNIEGEEYQHGTLYGYELREYLLERHQHRCAYCEAEGVVLEREHVAPTSRGGSDRVANQVVACVPCNKEKDNLLPAEWLAKLQKSRNRVDAVKAKNLAEIMTGLRPSLRGAAVMNATRYAVARSLRALGLPVTEWTGGRTKYNRTNQGYPKDHWLDAACVGPTGEQVFVPKGMAPLWIKAMGRGSRRRTNLDAYGFPRGRKEAEVVQGFRTGDLVVAKSTTKKRSGRYFGRVAVRAGGYFKIQTASGTVDGIAVRFCRKVQMSDGYAYG